MKKELILAVGMLLIGGCSSEEAVKQEEQTPPAAEKEKEVEKEVNSESEAVDKKAPLEESVEDEAVQGSPQYRMKEDFSIENMTNPDEKIVLLTIDDAPDKNGLQMAQTLKELDVKAIFFVNGHFIDTPEEGEILKKIHEMGFPIGNHTFNHKSLKDLSPEQQKQEIVGLNDRIEELTGERPRFFRAPFGINTDYSKRVAAEEKMLVMNWTYGYDWEKNYQSKDALADIMVNTPLLRNGANLLMHDRSWTSEALPEIVKGLQEKGYKIADPELMETP